MKWFAKRPPFFQRARGQVSDSVQTLPGAFWRLDPKDQTHAFLPQCLSCWTVQVPSGRRENHVLYFLKRFFFKTINDRSRSRNPVFSCTTLHSPGQGKLSRDRPRMELIWSWRSLIAPSTSALLAVSAAWAAGLVPLTWSVPVLVMPIAEFNDMAPWGFLLLAPSNILTFENKNTYERPFLNSYFVYLFGIATCWQVFLMSLAFSVMAIMFWFALSSTSSKSSMFLLMLLLLVTALKKKLFSPVKSY